MSMDMDSRPFLGIDCGLAMLHWARIPRLWYVWTWAVTIGRGVDIASSPVIRTDRAKAMGVELSVLRINLIHWRVYRRTDGTAVRLQRRFKSRPECMATSRRSRPNRLDSLRRDFEEGEWGAWRLLPVIEQTTALLSQELNKKKSV